MQQRLVQRHIVDAGEIEEHHVRLVARRELPDAALHAERAGAADRRRLERLGGAEPLARIGTLHARAERGHAHGFEHVEVVGRNAAVGADAECHAAVAELAGRRQPGAELEIAAGIVRDRGAGIGEPGDVVVIEPDRMRRREVRRQEPELVQMADQRRAVALDADDRLHLRFRHVHLHADAVLLGEIAAAGDECVGAVMRNGRPERGSQPVAVPRPFGEQLPAGRERHVEGIEADRRRALAQRRRHGVEQPGIAR